MSRPPAAPSPLLDVLGACWSLGAPIVGVAWSGDLAGFGLGDGCLALGRAEWDGAPTLEPVEGGARLTPGSAPPPPMLRSRVHDGACLAVAGRRAGAPGDIGFVSGGDDGGLALTAADGTTTGLAAEPGRWVGLVATGRTGRTAAATGRQVRLSGAAGEPAVIDLPAAATALQFDPAGARLAVAHYRGVTIWSPDAPLRLLATESCPLSLAWSPDGRTIVCGLQENALHGWSLHDGVPEAEAFEMAGYAGQPRSLSFSADGALLATSGSPRVICWRFDPRVAGSLPVECGLPSSRLPVCQVACHPVHPLIAAGYHNGAVLLCQPGSDDVLFVRASGGGSVTALSWSPDGARLAIGTQDGEAALVALPDLLFRFAPPSSPAEAGLNTLQQSGRQ